MNVPEVIAADEGREFGASSSNVKTTLEISVPESASEIKITLCPVGPTIRTSISLGYVCEMPYNVALTFPTTPVMPDTLIVDGYGVAALLSLMVM